MAQQQRDAGQAGAFQVKLVVVGRAPQPVPVTPGETVDQVLERNGFAGYEVTINQQVVRGDHVVREGENIVLKQRLQAGCN